MRFNTNLIGHLSTSAKIKVLKHVLNQGFRMTGRELGRLCGISHTMTIRILKEFKSIHLVSNFRAGKSVMWTTRTDSYAYKVIKKLYNEMDDYIPLEHLKKAIISVLEKKEVKSVVLFGSAATGKERESSDIDLFVLAGTQKDKYKINILLEEFSIECLKLYGNTLNQYVLTEKELEARKNLDIIKNIEKGIKII